MRVISIFWWPSGAAMASSRMPRLMAWVARVWRSRCGWTPGTPAAPATRRTVPPDEVAVQHAAVVGDQPLVRADVLEVRGGPGGEQPDELRVQRHVAVVTE